MNFTRSTAILVSLAVVPLLGAANWGHWRGVENNGVAEGGAPLTWSARENVKWAVQVPGRGHSTPVVWGKRIFLTTAVPVKPAASGPAGDSAEMSPEMRARISEITEGRDLSELTRTERRQVDRQLRRAEEAANQVVEHRFVVLAFARGTGEKIWERNPVTGVPHQGYHRRYGSFASGSPVTDGERLYVSFGSRGVFAYDLDGSLVWKKDYGVKMRTAGSFGEGISPTIHGETLILVFDHQGQSFISALNKRTGEELWRQNRDERTSWAQPLITEYEGRTQAIVAASGKIRSYDLKTGGVIWECAGLGSNVIPAVVRDADVVYAMSGHRDPNLVAIRLGGDGDITDSDQVLWSNQRGNSYTPSPVINDGILYFVTDRGLLNALDAKTGAPCPCPRSRT